MSFGDATLDFNDDGFIQVSGRNENPADMATSNGSGKSSLWEGVIWCLTGDTIRGTKQVSNLFGEDGTYVQLEFVIDNKSYSILRSKDHKVYKTSLQIYVDGKDCSGKGIRDSEKLLTEYLPDITASLLGSVIILGQGLPQKFTNNTPSGRKEVLEKLSKSDFMIGDLKRRISDRKDALQKDIRHFEDLILQNSTKVATLEATLNSNIAILTTLDRTSLQKQVDDLTVRHSNLVQSRDEENTKLIELKKQLEEFTSEHTKLDADRRSEIYAVETEFNKTVSEYKVQLNSFHSEYSMLKADIAKLNAIKDVCPTCGQRIPGVVKADTSSQEARCSELQLNIANVTASIDTATKEKESKVAEIYNSYKVKDDLLASKKSSLTSGVQYTTTMLNTMSSSVDECFAQLNRANLQLAQLDTTIENLTNQNLQIQGQISDIQASLLYNNNEKDLQKSHLEVVSKFDTAVKRDFRGYLLAHIITYIQQRAKIYSKMIFETENVEFYLEGNNIHISYMGKEYENLSGGEKQKIDLIVQFSIRDMLTNHLGFTSNILVLDEVFDGLDMIGCQKVVDVISNFNDVKNVFIVTHRKDLSIPCDRELIIVKSANGISEIK